MRAALVVGELALSLMLLVGAALLIVSFRKLVEVPTGFESQQLVTMRVTLPQATYAEGPRTVRFYDAYSRGLPRRPASTRRAWSR